MKNKFAIAIPVLALFIAGCGKQTAPPVTPDQPADVTTETPSQRLGLETDSTFQINPSATEETAAGQTTVSPEIAAESESQSEEVKVIEGITAIPEVTDEEPTLSIPIPTGEATAGESGTESAVVVQDEQATMAAELPERPREIQPALTVPDSSWQLYMIAPGDFLIKIAKHEYGDWLMWRKIYRWNRDEIGDNPNLIFPYHNLDLLKPREEVQNCEPEYRNYTVKSGDNLWTIAGRQFNDERAWIVLFWDNEELLDRTEGVLKPGMELKVRTNCIPLPD
ncbi:MAG: LysM peptidoglycan-binding domain-containing protein [FCB group bacterium]|nr:LysM peptidoglycan-binding domain-containing protein [FCB group bacterium]